MFLVYSRNTSLIIYHTPHARMNVQYVQQLQQQDDAAAAATAAACRFVEAANAAAVVPCVVRFTHCLLLVLK